MQRADVAVAELVVGDDRDGRHGLVDERERAVLELGGLVGLRVPVGDLLELLGALAGDRVAAHPPDEEQALGLRQPLGHLDQVGLEGQHLLEVARQPLQPGDEPLAVGDRQVADPAELQGEQREPDVHRGQRLGGRDRDLGAGVQVDAAVALAGDRAAHHVDQADAPAALAVDLLDGEQGVDGLAGLADRDVERVRLDDRVAVAELARRLGVRRDPGQLLDELGAHLADVVGRAAAEDLDPLHRPQVAGVHVEPAEVGGAEALVEPAADRALDRLGLLEHLLAHEGLVVARVVRRRVDVQLLGGPVGGAEVLAVRRVAAGGQRGHLAVAQVHDRGRVPDQRGQVGGDVHLLVADADDQRAPVAGHDDPVREVRVQDREPVGALDPAEGLADPALQGVGVRSGRPGGRSPRCRCPTPGPRPPR